MNHNRIADLATELHRDRLSPVDLAIAIRLEFANNWLSVGNFAESLGIPADMAERLLSVCRDIHKHKMES